MYVELNVREIIKNIPFEIKALLYIEVITIKSNNNFIAIISFSNYFRVFWSGKKILLKKNNNKYKFNIYRIRK